MTLNLWLVIVYAVDTGRGQWECLPRGGGGREGVMGTLYIGYIYQLTFAVVHLA